MIVPNNSVKCHDVYGTIAVGVYDAYEPLYFSPTSWSLQHRNSSVKPLFIHHATLTSSILRAIMKSSGDRILSLSLSNFWKRLMILAWLSFSHCNTLCKNLTSSSSGSSRAGWCSKITNRFKRFLCFQSLYLREKGRG